MPAGVPHYITKEGLASVREEITELKTKRRPDVVQKIEAAKDLGDLSENAEYNDAKDELAFVDGRIQTLGDIVAHAVIIEEKAQRAAGVVSVGSTVIASFDDKEVTYQIVGSNEADPKAGKISNESPLGTAFLGKSIGDTVTVKTPAGEMHYTIRAIE